MAWAGLAFALNLIWETGQVPLYTLAQDPNIARIVSAVVHCTLGDVIIAVTGFMVAEFALKTPDWPFLYPWSGGVGAVAFGLAYTVFSEWYNVYKIGAWAYSARMPLVFGVGLAPLLQWLVVPVATILLVRTWDRTHAHKASGATCS